MRAKDRITPVQVHQLVASFFFPRGTPHAGALTKTLPEGRQALSLLSVWIYIRPELNKIPHPHDNAQGFRAPIK